MKSTVHARKCTLVKAGTYTWVHWFQFMGTESLCTGSVLMQKKTTLKNETFWQLTELLKTFLTTLWKKIETYEKV